MGELFGLGIVGTIVIGPIWFLVWAISSISSLGKKLRQQAETIETLQERLTRLQAGLWRLEKSGTGVTTKASANAEIPHAPARAFTTKPETLQAEPTQNKAAQPAENNAHSAADETAIADPKQVNDFFEQIEHDSHDDKRANSADLPPRRHKESPVRPEKPSGLVTDGYRSAHRRFYV